MTLSTNSLMLVAMILCYIVAVVMAAVRGEYKSGSGVWFFTGFALFTVLMMVGH